MESRFGQFVTACLFSLSLVKGVSAATYVVDPDQSFVTATTQAWVSAPYLDLITREPTGMVEWTVQDVEHRFALSGVLEVSRTPAMYTPNAARIQIYRDGLISEVPSGVGFALPSNFLQYGFELSYGSGPCFGFNFDSPPDFSGSCTGFEQFGYGGASEGALNHGVLTLSGYQASGFGVFPLAVILPEGEQPEPLGDTYEPFYSYELRAVSAVPEMPSLFMMLAGVPFVGVLVRRNGLSARKKVDQGAD